MLDIQLIRDNKKKIKKATEAKGFDGGLIDEVLEADSKRRIIIQDVEKLRAKRNRLTKNDILEGRKLKTELKCKEGKLSRVIKDFEELMFKIPNPSSPDVKVGKPEDNEILRKVGKLQKFTFPVKDHLEIGQLTDTIDIERGAKVAQSGFYYIKNETGSWSRSKC